MLSLLCNISVLAHLAWVCKLHFCCCACERCVPLVCGGAGGGSKWVSAPFTQIQTSHRENNKYTKTAPKQHRHTCRGSPPNGLSLYNFRGHRLTNFQVQSSRLPQTMSGRSDQTSVVLANTKPRSNPHFRMLTTNPESAYDLYLGKTSPSIQVAKEYVLSKFASIFMTTDQRLTCYNVTLNNKSAF